MMQHRRPRRTRSRTPPGSNVGSTGTTNARQNTRASRQEEPRKPLGDMTAAERQAWLLEHRTELEDFCSYAQEWTKGREQRSIHTGNDDRYDQFLERAADLIRGLDELRELIGEAIQEEEQ